MMVIGNLKPGVSPAKIVPMAASATRELTTVEASDVAVVSGAARVTVRFTGEDDAHARQVARHTVDVMRTTAVIVTSQLTRRDGGRWFPVIPA